MKKGFLSFIRDNVMVTTDKNGRKTYGTTDAAILWISKHVHTAIHIQAIKAGIATRMMNGSKVEFVDREILALENRKNNFVRATI